jgi:hypothetical protein
MVVYQPAETEGLRTLDERSSIYKTRISSGSRDSSAGIATGYGLDDRGVGVRVPVGSRIFSSPCRPDRLWGPHSLLSNGYGGHFPRVYSGRGVKLTTYLQLVPRSRKYLSIHPFPHAPVLGGSLLTTAWRVLKLRMEETAPRYVG